MTNLDSIFKSRDITLPTKGRSQSYCFSSSFVWMEKESWALKNWCFWTVVLKQTLESPMDCKEMKPVHPKGNQSWIFIGDWCWSWNSNILATWCEELIHLKRPWCWKRLKANGEEEINLKNKKENGDNRGWEGWVASPMWWTWVWVSSESWWWTGKPGALQSMGSQRVGHHWVTELNCL